jgi:hypothetical protein
MQLYGFVTLLFLAYYKSEIYSTCQKILGRCVRGSRAAEAACILQ